MLKTAMNKAGRGSVREAFKNEDGAIDLASIMVGIIVIGIIGGVIAATVFAVIPWAQDNAAKGVLDSVATAESAYLGFAEGKAYATETQLNAPANINGAGTSPLFTDSTVGSVAIVLDTTGVGYTAYTKSPTGKFFKSANGAKATEVAGTVTAIAAQTGPPVVAAKTVAELSY